MGWRRRGARRSSCSHDSPESLVGRAGLLSRIGSVAGLSGHTVFHGARDAHPLSPLVTDVRRDREHAHARQPRGAAPRLPRAARRGLLRDSEPLGCGSARYLEHLGFPALATTSAGFAFSQGLPDSDTAVSRDRSLRYIADVVAAVDVPVSADFTSGYGVSPQDVAESVGLCVATGVAGLSIEDATGDPSSPLYDLPTAVERVRAARDAIDRSGADVLLTARAECYHVGHPDPLPETVRRLRAYAGGRRGRPFRSGPHEPADITTLVEAVRPKPLNLLVVRDINLSVDDIAALGVRRISVGGAFALAAWTGFIQAAQALKSQGTFAGLANLVPYPVLNDLFAADRPARTAEGPA